jgi:hypothetical protein
MGLLLLMTLCIVYCILYKIYISTICIYTPLSHDMTRVITALTELNDVAIYLPESIQPPEIKGTFLKHR